MLWCRNCENLVYEQEADIDSECPICGYYTLTRGGKCEVCGGDMEEDNPAICPHCKEKVQKKWAEFKEGLEDAEIEYFLDNVIEWEDFSDPY